VPLARANGFNRHATLLMYLNDVPQVGEGWQAFESIASAPPAPAPSVNQASAPHSTPSPAPPPPGQILPMCTRPQGGATRFEHLDLEVTPRAGRLLVFFPSFSDGSPDERTLHTATAAVDPKWVSQQWVARGFRAQPAAGAGAGAGAAAAAAAAAAAVLKGAQPLGGGGGEAAAPVVAKTVASVPASNGEGRKKGGKGGKRGFGGR
jgi:hypothetical protein